MFDYYDSICILVMPTDTCNMNCKYCYHEAHFSKSSGMSLELLHKMMEITIPYYKKIHFVWHGGEPLLMGVDFYKEAMRFENEFNADKHCLITNGIQSNLTLLTQEYIDFFRQNNFHIGTSFDGTRNEITRGHTQGILNGRTQLIQNGFKCGCIMVVSTYNIDDLINSYHYFNEQGINYKVSRFINTDKSDLSNELEVDPEIYATKMNDLFDEWFFNTNNKINVNPFKNIIEYILFHKKHECCHTSCLGKWLGIRHDGTITNCNRYYYQQYHYGNILDYNNVREAFDSPGFNLSLSECIDRRNKCKDQGCDIYPYCTGGCNNVAMFENGMSNQNGASCISKRIIYHHIQDTIKNYIDNPKNEINPMVHEIIFQYQQKRKLSNKV